MNIKEHVDLKHYTTFEIGGPARYYCDARSSEDVIAARAFATEKGIHYYILAGGSNTLFSDKGFDGLVIHVTMDRMTIDEHEITVGAGAELAGLLLAAAQKGLSGAEKLAGVPGSVGGAVRGNAGAFGTEIADILKSVRVYDTKEQSIEILDRGMCRYGYRTSIFKELDQYIILDATFAFAEGKKHEIEDVMHDTLAARNKKHIQNIRSAGSFFINPVVPEEVQRQFLVDKGVASKNGRVPAGWLLERVDLAQKRIGDIQAGEMHANYFINVGQGTAEQALQLASLAKTRVRDEFGVQLKEEVQLVGF